MGNTTQKSGSTSLLAGPWAAWLNNASWASVQASWASCKRAEQVCKQAFLSPSFTADVMWPPVSCSGIRNSLHSDRLEPGIENEVLLPSCLFLGSFVTATGMAQGRSPDLKSQRRKPHRMEFSVECSSCSLDPLVWRGQSLIGTDPHVRELWKTPRRCSYGKAKQ